MAVANMKQRPFNFLTEYLEHGVCFINTPESSRLLGYINRPFISKVYTFGSIRHKYINQYLEQNNLKREVIEIGPYILYAKNFYDEEKLGEIKKKYGKILLVYPQHSIEDSHVSYEIQDLISEIKSKSHFFDSVFVCLYWKDILIHPDYVKQYEDAGFTVVSNGHRSDPKFLSRQKDLIMLSDMMLTNGLGTHIGYSICLGKPVFFYNQKTYVNSESKNSLSDTESEFIKEFGDFSFSISNAQEKLVKEYWGNWNNELVKKIPETK